MKNHSASKPGSNTAKELISELRSTIESKYWSNTPIRQLLQEYSQGIDKILTKIWLNHFETDSNSALYAVGGYGRGELHPHSDIDLLLVSENLDREKSAVEQFFQEVFDLNLEVGHSARDIASCTEEASKDITVATAISEKRLIVGDQSLSGKIEDSSTKSKVWPSAPFFSSKLEEQKSRHKQFEDSEYNLEPNVKSSPGALRDIHTILWICQKQYETSDIEELAKIGVLTDQERDWLIAGRDFLWWVRFGLHLLAGRKEDRLTFAYQRELALKFSTTEQRDTKLLVESFMQQYYQHAIAISEVNDIIMQHFRETMHPEKTKASVRINDRFSVCNGYLELSDESVFENTPSALMEMFVVMANNPQIEGVHSKTIRIVRDSLHLINESFRSNKEICALFIKLLKSPFTLVSQLTRMRRYGILGRYIPAFGSVIGQMQHDLFHTYTVDAHTMLVIRNMRRFRYRSAQESYPIAYHCARSIPKVELLYLAGLFHDIGKGSGTDHSIAGSAVAGAFCESHKLSNADTELVCWLVENHLYMSTVSQREDIYDPKVVINFASKVNSEVRLDYLYALTVADINATNPSLWNSWRATLLRHLYLEARKVLRNQSEYQTDRGEMIKAHQERALEKIGDQHAIPKIEDLWSNLGHDVFLRNTAKQIAKLTEDLLSHNLESGPFVEVINLHSPLPGEGATQIHVYDKDKEALFARSVACLAKQQLSIMDASINTNKNGICFDTYTVLNQDGEPIESSSARRAEIKESLIQQLSDANSEFFEARMNSQRVTRQLKEFKTKTKVQVSNALSSSDLKLRILAADRPGLLVIISRILLEHEYTISTAKIATLGENIEDTFVIQGKSTETPLDKSLMSKLEQQIASKIDQALHL